MTIKNYNKAKPFASFLAGIAGLRGIPLWTFYVNRGQGICSFGINNKDNSITEFYPAHQSYQYVSSNGFRTFIKGVRNDKGFYYEPFTEFCGLKLNEDMEIGHNTLSLLSVNERDGLNVKVDYFTMPNENCAALVRRVYITNTLETPVSLEVLDGLPFILPFGSDYGGFKNMGNTLKAWMDVFDVETKVPIYRVRSSTADSAEVTEVKGGHFYMSFTDEGLVSPIVDARNIFGANYSLSFPDEFLESNLDAVAGKAQVTANKVPAGFSPVKKTLAGGETLSINTVIGFLPDVKEVGGLARFIDAGYLDNKQQEANEIIDELLVNVETKTGDGQFDKYIKQCYLDNLLRGGYPLILGSKVYYVYSRKHGDLERDYNYFSLSAEYYSQGNGNFRDVNQNRRNDIYFNPKIGDYNVKAFFSFIQADGYNPLAISGARFAMGDAELAAIECEGLRGFLSKPFTPGKLVTYMLDKGIYSDGLFNDIFEKSSLILEADFGEGYWIDHFTYNIDLLNAYGEIFPDKLESLLFGERDVLTYDSPAVVRPRLDKHVVKNGKVRQYNAIYEPREKINRIRERLEKTYNGKFLHNEDGSIFKMSLYEKMVLLAVTKFSLLDPMGMGLEMEANKPGWNDSLNGMPGLLGSGVSELIELKIIVDYLLSVDTQTETINLPVELHELLSGLYGLLNKEHNDFEYWDLSASLREKYREDVKYGFGGVESSIEITAVNTYLRKFAEKLGTGMEKCLKAGNGLYPTYFYYEATDFDELPDGKARVKAFKQHQLPFFLEGIARGLKIADTGLAKSIYQKVKESGVYDKKLKMYKVNESLNDTTFEIGRGRAFTPGWLENESVFMHMEYKYLLSMLASGLYDEFFEDMKNVMPVYLDPLMYGRSVLENSSFIASSANPDPSLHGNGFVARLSGSTAEFLTMWFRMFAGHAPFTFENGSLTLKFKPVLPGWLFDGEGKASFKFLGTANVTYHNPERVNTYSSELSQKIIVTGKDGQITEFDGVIDGEMAYKVRDGFDCTIDVYFNGKE